MQCGAIEFSQTVRLPRERQRGAVAKVRVLPSGSENYPSILSVTQSLHLQSQQHLLKSHRWDAMRRYKGQSNAMFLWGLFKSLKSWMLTCFFELKGFLTILQQICRWTFLKSSIFSELQCFPSFLRIQENFRNKLKTIVISKTVDERSNNFQENHSLWLPTIWYQAKLFHSSSM